MDRIGTERKFQTRAGIQRKSKTQREQYAREEADRRHQKDAEGSHRPAAISKESSRPSTIGTAPVAGRSQEGVRTENLGGILGPSSLQSQKPRGRTALLAPESGSLGHSSEGDRAQNQGTAVQEATTDGIKRPESKRSPQDLPTAGETQPSSHTPLADGENESRRRDIEKIWISSDDEEQDVLTSEGKQRLQRTLRHGQGLRPVRAPGGTGERVIDVDQPRGNNVPDGVHAGRAQPEEDDMNLDDTVELKTVSGLEAKLKAGRRKATRNKDPREDQETLQEREERLQYGSDTRMLQQELLGPNFTHSRPRSAAESDTMASREAGEVPSEHRLYLLQFPPLTPFLVRKIDVVEIKQEPDTDVASASSPPAVDVGVTSTIKKEDGAEGLPLHPPDILTAGTTRLPGGYVGKLNIHHSGKVTLDWGGTNMELRYGTEVDFLQDVILTGGENESVAWALGQVQKKMVVIPDWQKLYE